jgi:immune inhibitor A
MDMLSQFAGVAFRFVMPALLPALCAAAPAATAPHPMPLNPEVVERAMARGERIPLAQTEAAFVARGERGINVPSRRLAPLEQTVKALAILVRFPNDPPGGPASRFSPAVYDSMLFGHTYVRGGADPTTDRTLKNYYDEVSYGTVDVVTMDMPGSVGWLTAPHDYAYYCQADGVHDYGFGPSPNNAQGLVRDAVLAADPFVDFSLYAVGGVVQNLFVIHAGSGAEWNRDGNLIWSHQWSCHGLVVDGVAIRDYSMEPECGGNTTGVGGAVSGPWLPTVGVYAHEFGHVLGLPDEYDYGYESQGTGRFSLMAGGSWNRYPDLTECLGNSPAHPSAWGRYRLGFVAPIEVTGSLPGVAIPPIESTNVGSLYKLTNPVGAGKEYWLVENRQQTGFDAGLVVMTGNAHGIVIYHVDENVFDRTFWNPNEAECVSGGIYAGNNNCDCATLPANEANDEKWYGLSVEQADGLYQMELGLNNGSWQDFYSSVTGRTAFTEATTPNTTSYYGCATSIAVTGISGSIGTMTANLFGPTSCRISPASIDFGAVLVGSSRDTVFTIANDGGGVVAGDVTEACGPYAIVAGGGAYSLGAGQSHAVTVRFAPVATGTEACAIAVGSAACGDVPCTGSGALRSVIDRALLVGPASVTVPAGGATPALAGLAWIAGVTGEPGATDSLVAQVGFGPGGSDPTAAPESWQWSAAAFAADADSAEQYTGTLTVGTAGSYDYAYRFRYNGGAWAYGDLDGSQNGYSPDQAGGLTVTTATDVAGPAPAGLRLHPNHPNPFNPLTTIRFDLPAAGPVRLAVFDLSGRLVRVLVDEARAAGSYAARWDGTDERGEQRASGVYMCRLQAGPLRETRRMTLVR